MFGPVVAMASSDTLTKEYKKAERQFRKATKNRPSNIEQEWTPFRAAEKRFKARFPHPDLSSVLDLATADESKTSEIELGRWVGSFTAVETVKISLKENIYTVPRIPGAPHLLVNQAPTV
jgi:alkylated DNA repair protein alkB family protein 1